MAKKKFRRKLGKVPILVAIPALAPAAICAMEQRNLFASNPAAAVTETIYSMGVRYTGYNVRDGKFYFDYMWPTWAGIFAGAIGHKIMNKLGVNRALARVPYVSL